MSVQQKTYSHTTKGKRTYSLETKMLSYDIGKEKKDWTKPTYIFGEVTQIFQELYDHDKPFGEKIMRKYTVGAEMLGNLPDYKPVKTKGIK